MNSVLRIGLIGCGRMARLHARGYKRAAATIAAVADVVPEAAAKLGAELGCPAFADYREMLATAQLDAVSVTSPPAMHRENVAAATASGIPILCEKPLAESAASAKVIAEAATSAGVIFMVGFFHRFHEPLVRLRELVRSGDLGTPVTVRSRFSIDSRQDLRPWIKNPAVAGGGQVMDTAVHSLDILRFVTGSEIEEVQALTAIVRPGPTVEDTALILARGALGNLGIVEAYGAAPFRGYELWAQGTAGEALVGWDPPTLRVRTHQNPEWVDLPMITTSALDRVDAGIAHFVDCVRTGRHPEEATGADGIRALVLAEGVYRSALSGSRVSV
jgi:predicted dehydrogenase